MKPKIVFAHRSRLAAMSLQQALRGCEGISVLASEQEEFYRLPSLDAIFLTLPHAERWGSRPLLRQAQVLNVVPAEAGLPPYVVTGVAMADDDPRDPVSEVKLIVSCVIEAIEEFNRRSNRPICVVGFWWPMLIRSRNYEIVEVAAAIREVYCGDRTV